MSSFSERLGYLLESRGITRRVFAHEVNVSERLVQYYISGEKKPNLDTIERMADYLNVSADYLLGRSDDPIMRIEQRQIAPEEAEFLKWVEDNLEGSFFYDFDKSPEDAKKHMMETLRLVWERERGRKPGQKQGE